MPAPLQNPSINTANNRINANQGYGYDTVGNLTSAPNQTFTYDAENRMVSYNGGNPQSGGGTFSYDGDGRRVKKVASSGTTIYVYNALGQLIAEYTDNPSPVSNGTSYLTMDSLGTPRIVTDATGSVKARHDYLPFGEEIMAGVGGRTEPLKYVVDNVRQKFTSKERDVETGLDYFNARYYSSTQGRFTSTDPSRISIKFDNPQTWNRYTYCLNNPFKYIDDNGKWPTRVHNKIIRTAFDKINPSGLERGSRKTDWEGTNIKTLREENAAQHAMTPGSMVKNLGSVEKAQEWAKNEAKNFIKYNLNEAKTLYDKAQTNDFSSDFSRSFMLNGAYEKFGAAMHTVMDNVSPAHIGFQVYWHSISPVGASLMDNLELQIHSAQEQRDPTEAEMNLMVDEMRLAYQETFGQEAYEKAVSEGQRKLTAERLAKRGSEGMLIR